MIKLTKLNIDDVWLKRRNLEPKNWGLFDIVGIFSIGVKMTLKVWITPMETTDALDRSAMDPLLIVCDQVKKI